MLLTPWRSFGTLGRRGEVAERRLLVESKLELNNKHFKQCKAAWMHNKQNIFVLFYKNNQSLFIFTKFTVKKSKCWKNFRV